MTSYDEFRGRSIEDLKKSYDRIAKTTSPGLSFYREEIARRESELLNHQMLSMTKHMRNMTIAISILTLVNVVAVLVPLLQKI
jgi:hypothetical protein